MEAAGSAATVSMHILDLPSGVIEHVFTITDSAGAPIILLDQRLR